MNYLNNLICQWNACRIVRLIAGVPILVMGLDQLDWPVILFGAIFVSLGLFTTQCCTNNDCRISRREQSDGKESVEFEELK